jgi:Zn-dependent protease
MNSAGPDVSAADFDVELGVSPEAAIETIASPERWGDWIGSDMPLAVSPLEGEADAWRIEVGKPAERFRLRRTSREPGRSVAFELKPISGGQPRESRRGMFAVVVEPISGGCRVRGAFTPSEGSGWMATFAAGTFRWKFSQWFRRWSESSRLHADAAADPDSAILAAVRKELAPPGPKAFNWRLLLGSIAAFVAFGWLLPSWRDSILWFVPILLVHEFSHYVAMRHFGYRNLHMMFIPFLGAVVSGHRFNVPGWKQCVVSLAGPLPSIAIAAVAGAAAIRAGWTGTADVLAMALVLNGFNLLPIFPLDGGQVVRATIFCRAPMLDAGFRTIAAVAVVAVGWWGGLWVLTGVGVLLLFGVPEAFRNAGVARRLRRGGFRTLSPDGDTIEDADVRRILAEIRAGRPSPAEPSALATRIVGTYQLLNLRPPGALASLGFLTLQVGGFAVAIGMARWIWRGIEAAGAA